MIIVLQQKLYIGHIVIKKWLIAVVPTTLASNLSKISNSALWGQMPGWYEPRAVD
jgi:hypothetical protein